MPNKLLVLICGKQLVADFSIPIPFHIVKDFNNIEAEIRSYPPSTRLIILFCDTLDQSSDAVLTTLSNRENVVVTLICDNSMNHLPTNQPNKLRISEHLITFKTVLYGIRAYTSIAKEFDALDKKGLGAFFDNKAKDLLKWLLENLQLKACHVLIIPLNTNRQNLIDCQQAMIGKFKILWPNKEIRVCTIYDYLLFEESDLNAEDLSEDISSLFEHHHRQMICGLIQNLAPIRIYLIGNERQVINYWSRLLVAKERNINENSARKYIDGCTFIEYEVVRDEIKKNVAAFLGTTWQIDRSRTIPITLARLVNDGFFQSAVDIVDDTLSKREDDAKVQLWQGNSDYRENNSDYSDELHSIDQSGIVRADQDEGSHETTDVAMQRDYRRSPENR